MRHSLTVLTILGLLAASATGSESAGKKAFSVEELKAAIDKSIPLLEKGANGSANERTCFTCHSQALPVMAIAEAKQRGFAVDEENYERQLRHTSDHLQRGKKGYLAGRGQGGAVLTAGYALWALDAAGSPASDVTSAVTNYLLEYQKDKKHWSKSSRRPPSSGSHFTATYVALRALAQFGTTEQQPDIRARNKRVGRWLLDAKPRDTEDHVFRLRSLEYIDADDTAIESAIADLFEIQRDDGGWAQSPDMESDAYATATALVALLRSGRVASDNVHVERGIRYLLDIQEADGSWHVVTRAEGFQKYFESGYPHGKDQFISITAASWATLALLLTLPAS